MVPTRLQPTSFAIRFLPSALMVPVLQRVSEFFWALAQVLLSANTQFGSPREMWQRQYRCGRMPCVQCGRGDYLEFPMYAVSPRQHLPLELIQLQRGVALGVGCWDLMQQVGFLQVTDSLLGSCCTVHIPFLYPTDGLGEITDVVEYRLPMGEDNSAEAVRPWNAVGGKSPPAPAVTTEEGASTSFSMLEEGASTTINMLEEGASTSFSMLEEEASTTINMTEDPRRASRSVETFQLLGRPSSINVQKVLWALEECSLRFELVHASNWLGPGQNKYTDKHKNPNPRTTTADYLAHTPTGLVPTLLCSGALNGVIYESSAIAYYVARKSGKSELLGGDTAEGQAAVDQLVSLVASQSRKFPVQTIIDNVARLAPEKRSRPALIQAFARSADACQVFEGYLLRSPYLTGKQLTVADIVLGTLVCRWKVAQRNANLLPNEIAAVQATPGLDAWFMRLCERPAFRRPVLDPERLHQGLTIAEQLPEWHQRYLQQSSRL